MAANENRDRHHGGQEPPDEVQDRPEQNAGYDEAVREGKPGNTGGELEADEVVKQGGSITDIAPDWPETELRESPDDRAEREAVNEVRRRERRK